MVWLSSFVGVITKVSSGDASLPLVVPLLIGGTFGLQAGVTLCNRMSANRLKRYFALVVLAATLIVIAKMIALIV